MINISESGAPSDLAIQLNVDALARYASICQVDSPLLCCRGYAALPSRVAAIAVPSRHIVVVTVVNMTFDDPPARGTAACSACARGSCSVGCVFLSCVRCARRSLSGERPGADRGAGGADGRCALH